MTNKKTVVKNKKPNQTKEEDQSHETDDQKDVSDATEKNGIELDIPVADIDVQKKQEDLHQVLTQKLESDVQLHKDKALRAFAELENFKKRKEQEKKEFMKFSTEKLLKELLPVIDSLNIALNQKTSENQAEVAQLLEGFKMIQKQFESFLEKCGMTKIEAMDQVFDPLNHQAVSQSTREDVEENTVIEVMQEGYKLHDRVLRPAMVVVSKKDT